MKRWQKIVLGMATAVLLFLAWALYPQGTWPFVPRFAQLEGLGAQYDVEILRDSYGVPHIYGRRDADAAFGLGYAHAEDDFLTIQQAFVAARGKLGAVYGIDAAPNDYMVQLLRIWDVVDSQYDTIPADVQAIMQGYADGLNYYAALHPDEVLLPNLWPISGQDVAAGFIHRVPLFFGLDGVLGELFAEERQRPLTTQTSSDTAETAVAFQLVPPNPSSPIPSPQHGSNAIAVSPARSANGETFLAVNSHQPWTGIVAWYEAHMHSEEGWNMVGGLLPGSPTITHGHNEHLGWAFTVNSPDLADVYVLDINPDNPNQYRFDGAWRELEVRQAPITVSLLGRFRWTVKREVLWSVYGPTVRQDHGTYALRYAGMGEIGHVEQFVRLNKATHFDEWSAAMRAGPLPMFNAGYADEAGNIFYLYNGRIPQRAPGYDWEQYLPGDTSETLWTAYVPFAQLPQVLNPASGFIQNSNNSPFQTTTGADNPNPASFPPMMGIDDTMSNRSLRSLELFGNDTSITAEEFYTYKYDMGYTAASDMMRMVQMILDAPLPQDADEQTAVALLADWDGQATPDSQGASVAVLTMYYLLETDGTQISVSNMTEGVFTPAQALDSLAQATALLRAQYGRIAVPWQAVNRLVRGDLNLGLGGAPDVLHAVYGELGEDGRFHGVAGDSYILLVTWDGDGRVSSQSIHQFGSATLNETSPHYADQAPIFVQRQLKPVWFEETAVRANLERSYRPGEEVGQ